MDERSVPGPSHKQPTSDEIDSDMEDDFNDSEETDDKKTRTQVKQKKTSRPQSKLPVHLQGLMGEANLRIARGDFDTAKRICFEVIRQCPEACEPHLALSQIYETDEPERSFQHRLLAVHLKPSDVDQWLSLAHSYYDSGNLVEAIRCYSKVICYRPDDVETHRQRIALLKIAGKTKMALRCMAHLANRLTDHEEIIELVMETAKQYHELKDYDKAIDALNIAIQKCPDKVPPTLINILLDLLLVTKNYSRCLDVFLEFCNIEIEIIVGDDNQIKILSYSLPENLLIDLMIKFIVCCIKLGCAELVSPLINKLIVEEDAENVGDLFLDVAEALMDANLFNEAFKLLVPLVKSSKFSLPAVWLKHAKCLNACGLLEQAIDSYYMVMNLAPEHIDVRATLASILLELGRKDEASQVLAISQEGELNLEFVMKQIELFKTIGDFRSYFEAAERFLARNCIVFKHKEEISLVIFWDRPIEKFQKLKKLRDFRHEDVEGSSTSCSDNLTAKEEYEFFKEILKTCLERKEYALLQKFAFMGLTSRKLPAFRDDIVIAAFFACLYNRDTYHAFYFIREMLMKHPKSRKLWNLFNIHLQQLENVQYNKAMLRLIDSCKVDNMRILRANYLLNFGNLSEALNHYLYFFRREQNSFLSFMLGNTLLQYSFQPFGSKKRRLPSIIIALFSFYARKRGKGAEMEIFYNLGRLYHQFGVLHVAEHYYKMALDCQSDLIEKRYEILGLKREAAFNLHLIYKQSKNFEKARNVLMKYIVI